MEENGEIRGWVLRPVESEACDGLEGLRAERDGDGLGDVGVVWLPFRRGGAVDGGEGELANLEIVGGCDGEALSDVACHCGDGAYLAVLEHQSTIWWELVGCGVVVTADLDRNGGVGEGLVSVGQGSAEAVYGGCGLV